MGDVRREVRRSLATLALLLATVALSFIFFASHTPPLQPGAAAALKTFPPRSIHDLAAQRDALLQYAEENWGAVLVGWTATYLAMQTFAIPGTLTLSVLGGALYGVRRGSALVAVVSTLGSCSCYALSWAVGGPLVAAAWPERLAGFTAQVRRRRADLLSYIIFLRVTPLLPNTFINVAAPIVGVPLLPFALGTLLGCAPNNYIAASAGERLGELASLSDLTDARTIGFGLLVGGIALGSVALKHHHLRAEEAAAAAAKRR